MFFNPLEKKMMQIDENGGKYALIDYTFIHIKKLNELDAESIGKINVWFKNSFKDISLVI